MDDADDARGVGATAGFAALTAFSARAAAEGVATANAEIASAAMLLAVGGLTAFFDSLGSFTATGAAMGAASTVTLGAAAAFAAAFGALIAFGAFAEASATAVSLAALEVSPFAEVLLAGFDTDFVSDFVSDFAGAFGVVIGSVGFGAVIFDSAFAEEVLGTVFSMIAFAGARGATFSAAKAADGFAGAER